MTAVAARILRELDSEGLLGSRITVAGANALYAYEITAGVWMAATLTLTGMARLLAAPQFEETIIASDGAPARTVTPEPRTVALHKFWVGNRSDRAPVKRAEDLAHSKIVATIAEKYLALPLVAKGMPWLSPPLRSLINDVKAASANQAWAIVAQN